MGKCSALWNASGRSRLSLCPSSPNTSPFSQSSFSVILCLSNRYPQTFHPFLLTAPSIYTPVPSLFVTSLISLALIWPTPPTLHMQLIPSSATHHIYRSSLFVRSLFCVLMPSVRFSLGPAPSLTYSGHCLMLPFGFSVHLTIQ